MATVGQWIAGARPRTLPAAVSPVLAGTGVVADQHGEVWWKAALALVVSLALQVGVNYANDYSDGIRGTDAERVGPLRLTGAGLAVPRQVRGAAFTAFGVAAVIGTVLAATTAWWLVLVGAGCVLAAWFYTGGSRPYGYLGLGEVMVFCCFGLVAVLGTAFVQDKRITVAGLLAAVGIGCIACAILVANNLRDIATDEAVGKRTLAVLLGDARSRTLYVALLVVALAALVGVAAATRWLALLGAVAAVALLPAAVAVGGGATGRDLIAVLQRTGVGELLYAAGLFAGVLLAR